MIYFTLIIQIYVEILNDYKQLLLKVCACKMRLNYIQYTSSCIQKQNEAP
jgi:hypothetical protein